MNTEWEQVKLFHQKFNHPVSEHPQKMEYERALKRYNWMLEEIDEFLEAVKNQETYKGILNGEDIIPKTKKEKVDLTVSGHFIPAFSLTLDELEGL